MSGRCHFWPRTGTMSTWLCRIDWLMLQLNNLSQKSLESCWMCVQLCDIDDILVYSNTMEQHITHVPRTVITFAATCSYHVCCNIKAEKCAFHQTTTTFLGYMISYKGWKWTIPRSKQSQNGQTPPASRNLRRFMGFDQFYRCFIRGYSSVAAPLTTPLCGKPRRLHWSQAT